MMPSSSRRNDEPPLSHAQSQLAGRILKKRFNPALGSDQLSRAAKLSLVELVNTAFEREGLDKKYTLTKLDCWTSNALYRWRCVQQQRRPLSWQPKGAVAAAKKTAKTARRDDRSSSAATARISTSQKDTTRAACNHTPPSSQGSHKSLSPVFDTTPGTDYTVEASATAATGRANTGVGSSLQPEGSQADHNPFSRTGDETTGRATAPEEHQMPRRQRPTIDADADTHEEKSFAGGTSSEITSCFVHQFPYDPTEAMFTVSQPLPLSTGRSHVSRGLLADHSGSVIIDEPVLHPPSSINESSDWLS